MYLFTTGNIKEEKRKTRPMRRLDVLTLQVLIMPFCGVNSDGVPYNMHVENYEEWDLSIFPDTNQR